MATLYLIRGLPGSGKSTLGYSLAPFMYSADDFFMVDTDGRGTMEYHFDPTKLGAAHAACQDVTGWRLARGHSCVVTNTFCERWELEPYFRMARGAGAHVVVISLFDQGFDDEQLAARCVHGVPVETIAGMRERFDHTLTGDPRAPWER